MSDVPHIPDLRLRCAQDHHNQAQSPLFSKLPPELRNEVFALALHYFDISRPYPLNSYYRRPDYEYPEIVDPRLLFTCRRVYAEMGFAVHTKEYVFWCHRAPPGASNSVEKSFGHMNEIEKRDVRYAHFFTQLYYLEQSFPGDCRKMGEMGLGIRSLKITIRQSDWWYWESNTPLVMKEGWGRALHHLKDLESLDVELEVIKRDVDQLQVIIDRMLHWTFDLASDRILSAEGQDVSTRDWNGPSDYEGRIVYDAKTQRWTSPSMWGIGVAVDWSDGEAEEEGGTMEDIFAMFEGDGAADDWQPEIFPLGDGANGGEGEHQETLQLEEAVEPQHHSDHDHDQGQEDLSDENDEDGLLAPENNNHPHNALADEVNEWAEQTAPLGVDGLPEEGYSVDERLQELLEEAQQARSESEAKEKLAQPPPPLIYVIKTLKWRARAKM